MKEQVVAIDRWLESLVSLGRERTGQESDFGFGTNSALKWTEKRKSFKGFSCTTFSKW